MDNRNKIIIGNGVLFPIILSKKEGGTQGWYPVKGDPDLIKHNLITLLEYHIGQRLRQEYYGSRLWECLEEPSVPMLLYIVNQFIQESILAWEPRINFQKVSGYLKGSKIYLNLEYKLADIPDSLSIEFKDLYNS